MGPGIALSLARRGRVTLVDQSTARLDEAADELARVTGLLIDRDELTEEAASAALDRIDTATDIAAVADADYVTEAVTEDLDVNREVFTALERHYDDVILADNTSSLDLNDIATAADRPEGVIVTHWMNPRGSCLSSRWSAARKPARRRVTPSRNCWRNWAGVRSCSAT